MRAGLIAYAQAQFQLSKPANGATEREHLMSAERQLGRDIDDLRPQLPCGCRVLWDTFVELHNARGSTGMGIERGGSRR